MCHKITFGYRQAHEIIGKLKRRKYRQHGKQIPRRVYYCDECHGWHLTSQKCYRGIH